jgi:hypothetical protein
MGRVRSDPDRTCLALPFAQMPTLREIAKKVLPESVVERYRRRRTLRRYLRTLSYELYDRQQKMDVEYLEGIILARRPDLTERMLQDVLERTDLVLQQLNRQIEGLRARHGNELRELREEVAAVRASLAELERQLRTAPVD